MPPSKIRKRQYELELPPQAGNSGRILSTDGTDPLWLDVLPAVHGGTGHSSFTIGDIFYADTPSTLAKLPAAPAGFALISNGTGAAPSWGKVDLTTRFIQTNSVTVGNTTVEGSLFGTGVGTLTIPANALKVGMTYRVKASGFYSRAGSGGATQTLRFKIGGTTVFTVLGSITATNAAWSLEFDITVRSIGVTGSCFIQCLSRFNATVVGTANTAPTTINTTVANTLDLTVQWSVAAAGNTNTSTNVIIEELWRQ